MTVHTGAAARGLGLGLASILLGGALSACGSSPVTGALAGTVAQQWVDFPTVLADESTVKQTLPDPATMPGWKSHRKEVDTADGTEEDCPGCKLSGTVDFEASGAKASFMITTFAGSSQATAYLTTTTKKAGQNASPIPVATIGNETHAFSGTFDSDTGDVILMRVGTVVAGVMTTGPSDVPRLQKMATMLARRIEQSAAGQHADAALDTA
ncbi:hypothetical protein ABT247_09190 [Kitasatospora sp. NPDC001539]|uniref:hypothetical protein n=1 Tax=Kitasatospora sp. NPDC001539 TaxID=3154384 RepID=UPI003320E4A3